jgi:hypothetical protein
MGVLLGHIQRGQRARVGHQVPHSSGAPHGIQTHLALISVHGS